MPRRGGPEWLAKRRAWDAARRELQIARWGGTIDEIVSASGRRASAESTYVESLESWAKSDNAAGRETVLPLWYHLELRQGALDLIDHGRTDAAIRLLDGPLRRDRSLLPIRARAVGLHVARDSGLALLAWPPDRRGGRERLIRWDFLGRARGDEVEAAHVAAAELSDSVSNPRARRAALWTLLQQPGPSLRSFARLRLARSLVARGEPRLAAQILSQAYGIGDDEKVLLVNLKADLAGAMGDTLWGAIQLVNAARDPEIATAARYAIVKRAADWVRNSRIDSLDESTWLDLVRMLGEVGEAETALAIFKRRHASPRDPAAALARAEMEASLFARLKKNADAASAYGKLLAREDLPGSSRAKYALGLARARRGLGDFEAMDRTFLLAVSLDSTSATAAVAAWERAREWEDRKTPAEALAIFSWTRRYVRDAATTQALMAHATIACLRAGQPDSALPFIVDVYENQAHYWRGRIDFAKGDSAAAFAEFAKITLNDPWTYEGVRASEELARRDSDPRRPGEPAARSKRRQAPSREASHGRTPRFDPEIPIATRLLGAVGATDLMVDELRDRAQREDDPMARSCIDALEEIGIFRVGRADGVPRERLEYPPAYPVAVIASAKREGLSAALLWAIMRQESAYQRAARSKAGALGLLQLLPSTASRLNGAPVPEAALTEADLNVRLGAKYLRGLVTEFGDPRAAMAAYNAGEEAVRRWLRDRPVVDDLWVELIPYRETRDYVKQVYTIWRRYEALYGVPSADQL